MWLKLLGLKLFLIQKNDGARAGTNCLFKDRSGKSGSILQRSLSKLASDVCDPLSSDFSVVDCVNRKIKVWDLAAALDPRAPTGTLCVRTLVVSMAASCGWKRCLASFEWICSKYYTWTICTPRWYYLLCTVELGNEMMESLARSLCSREFL